LVIFDGAKDIIYIKAKFCDASKGLPAPYNANQNKETARKSELLERRTQLPQGH